MKLQNRVLSRRENILLFILIIIIILGFYYLFVYQDVQAQLNSIEIEMLDTESNIAYKETASKIVKDMRVELDMINSLPEDYITEIPLFDNEEALLEKLKPILAKTDDYNISFAPNEIIDNVVRKNINISFTVLGFDNMYQLLEEIQSTGFRFLVNEFQFSVADQAGEQVNVEEEIETKDKEEDSLGELDEHIGNSQTYSVSLGITFFERLE